MANGNGAKSIKYLVLILTAVGFFIGVGMNWNKILAVDTDFNKHIENYNDSEKRDDRQDCDIVELKGDVSDIRQSQQRMELNMREQRTETRENFKELKYLIKSGN